jgi:hypothetical protein
MCYTTLQREEIIEQIRNKSNYLRIYYDSISYQIREKIHYVVRNNPIGNNQLLQFGLFGQLEGYNIIFDSNDISNVRESIIAHEFEHIILRENRFPFTHQSGELEVHHNISKQINNLLQHQLIYRELLDFGFNVEQDYLDIYYEKFKNQIGFNNNNPINLTTDGIKLFRLYFADNYSIQNAIFNENIDNELLTSFITSNYARIFRQSNLLLRYIEQQGYDTADEQISLLRNIINRYSLNNIVNGYFIENNTLREINLDES